MVDAVNRIPLVSTFLEVVGLVRCPSTLEGVRFVFCDKES